MMADTRLRDDRNLAAERSVSALEQQDIFVWRQIYIGIAVDRNYRDFRGRERNQ
jgi:hypothetical protein